MPSITSLWKNPRAPLFGLLALLWVLVLAVGVMAAPVALPFVLAALAAYVIDPLIQRLTRIGFPAGRERTEPRHMPRWVAVLVVYVLLGFCGWLLGVSVVPQVYREAMRGLGELRDFLAGMTPERIEQWALTIDAFLQRYGVPLDVSGGPPGGSGRFSVDLAGGIAEALRSASLALRGGVRDVVDLSRAFLSGAFSTLLFLVLLFMLTAFISMDAPRILHFPETLVPAGWRHDMRRLLRGIDSGLAGVVRGQLTIMLVNGVLTLIGLLVLRVPFAFALAALATLLYVVPIFGTIISTVPIVLLALGAGGLSLGLLALAWVLAIHALETYILNPKIMGDASKIHPVLIVLALVVGERSYGLVGALLAVPVASVFVAVFRFLHKKLGELDARSRAAPSPEPEPAPAGPITKGNP
jgi:predicted PurR-regulated permease PerM